MAKRHPLAQELLWRLEAFGYDIVTGFFRMLPLDVASAVGGRFARLVGPLNGAHRTARINLALAFPEMPHAVRERLLGLQWESIGRGFAEFPNMHKIRPSTGRVELVNSERLAEIRESGKPVVFISGHFSNWEVMPAAIVDVGVPCLMTHRAANNPYMDIRIRKSRARYGVEQSAPKGGDGARELLDALSRGFSVALMNDQKFNGGVEGPFFGHTVHTAPGPTRMAIRFGTVLQPMSVERTKGARFRAIVYDPIEIEDTGDRTADIERTVARINVFMEERVRARPEEWFWVHKRWPNEVYRKKR